MLGNRVVFLILLSIIVLTGCMGLKKDINDCNNVETSAKVACYRQVALTLGANGNIDLARQACEKIDPTINLGSDPEYFNTEKNLCYYDVATVSNDAATCNLISGDVEGSILTGSSATEKMCLEKINHTNLVKQQYVCPISFIFPAILLVSFYANSIKKK
jgi:hypothetical protein